jgi:large repetitive protein
MLDSAFRGEASPEEDPEEITVPPLLSARNRRSRSRARRQPWKPIWGIEQLEVRTLLSASAASQMGNGSGSGCGSNSQTSANTAPAFTSAANTTFTVGTFSSFTVTATGSPTPTFTGNGLLPNGVTFNDATGVLSGTPLPGTGGTYDLTFTASNSKSTAVQNFVLTVNQAPTFTSSNATTFTVGANGSFTVTASGFPTPTLSESGALPSGVSFDPSTGLLSGTPQAGTVGTYPLVFTASNGIGSAVTQQFTLSVDVAPTITSANATTFTVGTPGSFTVTATGTPTPTLAGNGILPNGVVFDDATGLLSGTPLPGTGGTYVLTFTASNGATPNANQSFILTVDAAPSIVSDTTTTFTVGTAGTFTVTTQGFPAPTLSESGTLPLGVSFNTSTGVLSGTPQVGEGGIYPLEFTATNGIGSPATQDFTLIVNAPPAITSANATTFSVGTSGSFTVTASGVPAPTFSETGALPNGVSFNDSTGVLTGTPSTGTGGTFDLTFTASNGVSPNATQSFILTVDEAPAITSVNGTTFTVGTSGTFTVTASGFPKPTFAESGTLPSGVTFGDTTGVLSGTPQAGSGGTYDLTFTPTNSVGSGAPQSFVLIVDQAPAITSTNGATFTVGTSSTFDVSTSGVPGPTLSETGALPNGVTFNTSTGELSGTPQSGTVGTYDLTFTANNGISPNATQSFVLIVDEAPAFTSANGVTFTVGTSGTFTATASGFPAPTFSETGALPSGVTFNDSTGVLSGTPLSGAGGPFSLTFTASNGIGATASQSFTLTLVTVPQIVSPNSTTFVVGTSGSFTVQASGSPTPTVSESGTPPTGVSFNAQTDTLSGTPATGTGGTYTLTFTASNGSATNATQTFTLVVDEAPAITSNSTATFTVGTAGSFTLTATGFPAPTFNLAGTLPDGLGLSPAGVLSGTPLPGTGGTYTVTFTPVNSVGAGLGQTFTIVVDEPPAITSAATTTFTVGTAGNFTVIANGFPGSTFAETGTLPSGVSFNDTTGVLSGTPLPGSGGTYALTFTPTNATGTGPAQTFTLVVQELPAITSSSSTTFSVSATNTFTVTASGFPAATFSELNPLPNGVSFNSTTGVLSGTPLQGGLFMLDFIASNAAGASVTQVFTLIVDQAPAFTSGSSTVFTVGTAGSFSVSASGFPASTFSETGALPAGVSFNQSTGVLSGTPQTGAGGSYALTITASNGISPNATQAFTLVVNEDPQVTSANSTTFTVGTAGTFTVTASGFPAASFAESGTLPNGVSFDSATGVLSGTPVAGTGGNYTLTFTPMNAAGMGPPQTFTLTVLQDPAITSSDNATFTVGGFTSFDVIATGFPDPTLTESGLLPGGVTFDPSTGVLSGVPESGTAGSYTITFAATNGVDTTVMQTFTLVVNT